MAKVERKPSVVDRVLNLLYPMQNPKWFRRKADDLDGSLEYRDGEYTMIPVILGKMDLFRYGEKPPVVVEVFKNGLFVGSVVIGHVEGASVTSIGPLPYVDLNTGEVSQPRMVKFMDRRRAKEILLKLMGRE